MVGYDFYPTWCMFSIPEPRLGDRKYTTLWIKIMISNHNMSDTTCIFVEKCNNIIVLKARWGIWLPNIHLIDVVLYDVKECPIPPDIPDALKLYNGTLAGSRTLYACPPGFLSSGGSPEVVCDGLAWSTTSYSCSGQSTHLWYTLLF